MEEPRSLIREEDLKVYFDFFYLLVSSDIDLINWPFYFTQSR
jgi:hypothetical protein